VTKAQAHAEASRRWADRGDFGSSAQICLRQKKYANRCMVGYLLWKDAARRTCDPLLLGEGPTWEAAFADADKREGQGLPPLRVGFL
jgi:hypothetical protein